MSKDRKPNALLATAIAASGLLLAAFGRGRAAPPRPARVRARTGSTPRTEREALRRERHDPRGRDADHPAEIPPRGWWDILKRTASEISEDRVLTEAAGITFFTLLALFPAIAALVSIYGLFADPAEIERHFELASGFVPGGGLEIMEDQVRRIAAQGQGALGFGVAIGLATSLWSANQAMKAIVDALNVVYDEKEKRGYFTLLALTLALTLGGIIFVLLAIAGVVLLPIVLSFIGLGDSDIWLRLARWPLLLIGIGVFLAVVYRYGPSRQRARWRWISLGSAAAAILWVIGSIGFSWYVTNFGSYNETYGSLGAVIGFMTWIWLSATIVLAGAELDAEMEHQTARDTTTGPERPMGTRGAKMADTVAG
jgi:membrane protein